MPRIQLESQDAVLVRLAMWPDEFTGKTVKDVPKDQRKPIYVAREKLAGMLTEVRLPGIEDRKYRTKDVDDLIERSTAAAA